MERIMSDLKLLSIEQVMKKYPELFTSTRNCKDWIARNRRGIREIVLRIRNKTYFEETSLQKWVLEQTYKNVISNQYNER
jgi:hypothetical protein